jgi:diadenosine tetraphosphate (Ap4A) HIT family hydrolase
MSISNIILGNGDQSLLAIVPSRQIRHQSVQVLAPGTQFTSWSAENHADSYLFMQRIAKCWKSSHLTDQHLVYGKIDEKPFNWEIIPYQKCHNFLGRAVQQLQVLWRTVFGGIKVSEESGTSQARRYQVLLERTPEIPEPSAVLGSSNDSFCNDGTIDRQWVITGKKVNVLFNYAPIGFGGERLHFLVVPKMHRETFSEVTQEEYCESLALTTKLIDHFSETRQNVKNAYLMHKTGIDAGQSVKHWHLHVIFSTNTAQNFWGRITVIRNILFGSSPLKRDELARKVGALRVELASV